MRNLANATDRKEIVSRLLVLKSDAQRRWGKMSVNQMLCHLSDSFRARLGEKEASPVDNLFLRTIFKWGALFSPTPWPHGVKSRPEMDQEVGGTPSKGFDADREELIGLLHRVVEQDPRERWRHPFFGPISYGECMRWAYLHMDHHLRQFGV